MIDLKKDNWVVKEPILEDDMKRFIVTLLFSTGMRYSREDVIRHPAAFQFPYLAKGGENEFTAFSNLNTPHKKGFKEITIRELLTAIGNSKNE